MSSIKSTIEEQIKNSVEAILCEYSNQLSDWFNENKNVEITGEEIREAFNVTMKTPSTPNHTTGIATVMPNLPGYLAGAPTPKKRGGRTKKEVDPNASQCEYVKTKGKDPGSQCANKALGDGSLGADRFCKQCLKKASVKNQLEGDGAKSTVKAPNLPGSSVKVETEPEETSSELQAMAIPGRDGVFREATHGFIVEPAEDGNIVAIAICPEGEDERPLNDTERQIAQNMGMQILKPDTPKKIAPKIAVAPQVAQVPKPTQ